jgi:multidrug resistance efflux pump
MSPTMFLGRVVLPAIGLLLAGVLVWQTVRDAAARTRPEASERRSRADTSALSEAAPGRITAEGRVVAYPGAEVTVGSEVLGTIIRIPAHEKTTVHTGDLLMELRADDVLASLREAHARLVEAEADLLFEKERFRLDRVLPALAGRDLRPPGTRHELSAATARRDSCKAAIERLEAEAAKYRIHAPIDGVVVTCRAAAGETVTAASPLVTIADLRRLRVEAEVDEFDIGRIAVGQAVAVVTEGYGGRRFRAEVEEVGDVVVARQTRPEDPARPSDSRVLPVKVKLLDATPLKLGQRVEVEITATPAKPGLKSH